MWGQATLHGHRNRYPATLRFTSAEFERLVTAVRTIAFILTRLEHDDTA